MVQSWLKWIFYGGVLVIPTLSFSEIHLGLSGVYWQKNTQELGVSGSNQEVKERRTHTPLDAKVGWSIPVGLYFGLSYHLGKYETEILNSTSRAATITEEERKAFGPSLGFIKMGWSLLLSYYIDAEKTSKTGNVSDVFDSGKGMQVDLGYGFQLGDHLKLGPQLTWRDFSYETVSRNGSLIVGASSEEDQEILPMIALWIHF